jgi:hypothetical protein
VHHDTGVGIALGVAVAADMRARVEDLDLEAGFRQFACDDGARQTCADNSDFLTL